MEMMMNMPRCGNTDKVNTGDIRVRRYVLHSKWELADDRQLTWRVNSFYRRLGKAETERIMEQALQVIVYGVV